jgi:YVTN family beta-propeller protein
MTTGSANRPRAVILTSVLWITGFFLVASAPYGAHAEQHNPAGATTFGYVVNAVDNTVSVIDTASNAAVATIPVGTLPVAVATTPDGTRAYVTNFGDTGNGSDNTVSVIDTAKNIVVATIPVGFGASGVAILADEACQPGHEDRRHPALAYVTIVDENIVLVIDTARNTQWWTRFR